MTDLLPDPVAPDVIALDERFGPLSGLVTRLSGLPVEKLLVYLVDQVDAQLLLEMGRQFHVSGVEGWHLASTDAARRAMIKRSIAMHRKKGTPWSIRQALATLGFSARIQEWFEYGGAPYLFRVDVESPGRAIDEALWARLIELVAEYKNVRSHLETLTLIATTRAQARIGLAAVSGDDATVYPYMTTEQDAPAPVVRIAIGVQHWSHVTVWPCLISDSPQG